MKTYLSSLLAVCIVSAVVRVISPDGVLKKYIEMLCTICIISVVVIPIYQGISSDNHINDMLGDNVSAETVNYDEIYNDYLGQMKVNEAETIFKAELAERADVDADDIDIALEVHWENTECIIDRVRVILGPRAISVDPDIVRDYVYERIGIECEIIYDKMTKK